MYKILCNMKGSRSIMVEEKHLQTIQKHSLFCDLLDSNGIVDDSVLDKLRLNVRSLLESSGYDESLLSLSQEVIFHDNMKAFGLHQLILLYLDWEKNLPGNTEEEIEEEKE